MTVTKKQGGAWCAKPSAADIRHLEAVCDLLAPLVEVPVGCQEHAIAAVRELTAVLGWLNQLEQ